MFQEKTDMINQTITTIYRAIEDVEKSGASAIGINELKAYLTKLNESQGIDDKNELIVAKLEGYKAQLSREVEEYKILNQWDFELFRATINSGQSALKSAMLINGGASIALLTFIGKLWESPNTQTAQLAAPLQTFLVGVLLAAVAAGTTYLSQWFFSCKKSWQKNIGNVLNIASILIILGSYYCFLCGVFRATAIFGL